MVYLATVVSLLSLPTRKLQTGGACSEVPYSKWSSGHWRQQEGEVPVVQKPFADTHLIA